MFTGGLAINKDSDKVIRYLALLATPLFAGYNLLVMFHVAGSSNYTNDVICLIISALWIIIGAYHFFVPVRSRFDIITRLVVYHGLSLATVLFITGFLQPFASSVALLFLVTNTYLGKKGFAASVFSVVVAAIVDTIVRSPGNPEIIGENILGTVAILIFGVSLVGIVTAQETRRQALEKSRVRERTQSDRLLTIINNLTDATFSTDAKGNILMYNAASLDLLDTNSDLKSHHISSLFNLTDSEGKALQLGDLLTAATKATRRDDLQHSYSDGEKIRLEVTFAPIRSSFSEKKEEEKIGYVVIARDITKQKSLEEERDEFISVVSHELRTPITITEGTISNVQLMLEQPKLPDAKTLKSAMRGAHDQVLYLAKMVNDLSTLSRAERGVADTPEEIDVKELIHTMHTRYHEDARKKGLHLDIDIGTKLGVVHASRLYLEELLQNFITNAIKYTTKGSVTVSVRKKGNAVQFAIKDTGIGISRSDQTKVFEKFYRSEDYRIRETNGTGLGLYVSAKLARKLHTTIGLTSRLNHGSTFSFELPIVAEAEQPKKAAN